MYLVNNQICLQKKFLIPFFLIINLSYTDTFKIITYNILNFPNAIGMQRIDDFRVVINHWDPDILIVQEIQSQAGVDLFLDSVMNYQNNLFEAVSFNDGPDTDNGLFYRNDKLDHLFSRYLATSNRNIAEYKLRIKDSQKEFYVFSVHFKASQGSSNEAIRLAEATVLRNHLDSLGTQAHFLVTGDFNVYYSDEPAFHKLTDSLINNNGRLFDPLNSSGQWHENNGFAYIHSQSTRVDQLEDGGAGGGLDDRFDMILCSENFLDSTGLFLLTNSYTTCGNDGNHFNNAINYGYNQAVPEDVAQALYYASDHLPIFVNITDDFGQGEPEETVEIWPNPMDTEAQIRFPHFDDFQKGEITITNILGQRVYTSETQDPTGFIFRKGKLPVGIYFIHLKIETKYTAHIYHAKLAIIE